jgi:hypothetical protein
MKNGITGEKNSRWWWNMKRRILGMPFFEKGVMF